MSAYSRIALQLTALCLALSAVSFAADASLYVVHGVPGRDLAADVNPGFAVDFLLNDEVCYFRGLTFPGSSGPLTLPAGDYDIKISPSNSLAPCTNAPVAETTVKLSSGGSATVALALTTSGTPTLLTFGDNLNVVEQGSGRLMIANAANAGALQVTLTQTLVTKPKTYKFTINPGTEITALLPVGIYTLQATGSVSTVPLLVGAVGAENQSVELVYLVGSAANNSMTLVTRLIRDVF